MLFFMVLMVCFQLRCAGLQIFHILRHQGSLCIGIGSSRYIQRWNVISSADSHTVGLLILITGIFDVKLSALLHVEGSDLGDGYLIDSSFQRADRVRPCAGFPVILSRYKAQIRAVSSLPGRATHIDQHRVSGHGCDAKRLPGV